MIDYLILKLETYPQAAGTRPLFVSELNKVLVILFIKNHGIGIGTLVVGEEKLHDQHTKTISVNVPYQGLVSGVPYQIDGFHSSTHSVMLLAGLRNPKDRLSRLFLQRFLFRKKYPL